MTVRRRSLLLMHAALLVACAAREQPAKPRAHPGLETPGVAGAVPDQRSPPSPLLVILIVDQLPAWVLSERHALLPEDGGFARLRREGLYARELRYEHATTSTAPGHAALYTGLPPKASGIYANERPDAERRPISILADDASRLVLDHELEATSSSTRALLAPTLADALRAQRPKAEIFSLSLKDRAAIFGGGQRPNVSIWYDTRRGAFVTSSVFASALPGFVLEFNAKLAARWQASWTPLDPAWLAQHALTPDAQPGEADAGLGNVFPHDLRRVEKPAALFRVTPFADEALFELGLAALASSKSAEPRLLAISLSAFDWIGHFYGPDSWESWDELLRLDRSLARFLQLVEQRVGTNFSVLLSADHGSPPLPETAGTRARPWCGTNGQDPFQRPCVRGERLFRDVLEKAMRAAARQAIGEGDWIESVIEPFLYYTAAARALPEERRRKLDRALVTALEKVPGVARAFDVGAFPKSCPAARDESIEALVCRSLPPGAGDIYIVSAPGSFFDPNQDRGKGINHGSPYLYDRSVPLLVRSRGCREGEVLVTPVGPADFVSTAAALLAIEPPSAAVGGTNLCARPKAASAR